MPFEPDRGPTALWPARFMGLLPVGGFAVLDPAPGADGADVAGMALRSLSIFSHRL